MIPANMSAYYVRSGNNSNKIFDFDFPVEKPEDLIVIKLNSETDERKTLVFNSDYSIKEFSNSLGSSITYPINSDNLLSDKEKLLLISSREIKQQYLFNSSDDFDMRTFEKGLDYIVILIKQLDYAVSRTIKLPDGMDSVFADEFLTQFLSNIQKAQDLAEIIKNGIEYANIAEKWAEGTDDEVKKLGGTHSAKEWANLATDGQMQADWNEEDSTQKSYIKNKPDLSTLGSQSDWSETNQAATSYIKNKPDVVTKTDMLYYENLFKSNTSEAITDFKSKVVIKPDWSTGFIWANNSTVHTVPDDGFVLFRDADSTVRSEWRINTHLIGVSQGVYAHWLDNNSCFVPVKKGDKVWTTGNTSQNLIQFFKGI